MTHTHFRCSKPFVLLQKQTNKVTELYRELRLVNFIFKRSVVTEMDRETSITPILVPIPNYHDHFQLNLPGLTIFPVPFSLQLHSTLLVHQFPGPVYHDYHADLPDNYQEVDDLSQLQIRHCDLQAD